MSHDPRGARQMRRAEPDEDHRARDRDGGPRKQGGPLPHVAGWSVEGYWE
ncbi:hypothetical protein T8T21_17390 (plasmid) [Limimaricola variabilis]|nr:hypothetical protein [Limimaricola variabilis]WPY96624.1 hypothetical protein T8T21_17390 [Limimaricola variabilis]